MTEADPPSDAPDDDAEPAPVNGAQTQLETEIGDRASSRRDPRFSPERGFLLRLRSWRDAFPWLALGDCLRPATSIVSWALVAVALALSSALHSAVPQFTSIRISLNETDAERLNGSVVTGSDLFSAADLLAGPWLRIVGRTNTWIDFPLLLAAQLLLALVWVFPAGFLLRQSGLSMAGRLPMGTVDTLRLVARRIPAYLTVFIIPLIALLLCRLYFAFTELALLLPAGLGYYVAGALQLIGLPLALAVGLVGLASLAAIPLAWASISLEREGSSFDGLSRGFEYVLRRPLQMVAYGILGLAVLISLQFLATGVAWVAIQVLSLQPPLVMEPGAPIHAAPTWLASLVAAIPSVALITVGWSLVAWLYLLLRRSANYQEVEDVWEAPRPEGPELPQLDS